MGAWATVLIATNARFIGDITGIIIAILLGGSLAAGLIEGRAVQAVNTLMLKALLEIFIILLELFIDRIIKLPNMA
ncbi:hypothetical protein [Microbulbifer sp. THAF38]|uniref:hypothetical protein n=1 Tax=Microbulbifer sp. THAF38 TaxID=2587856 RepID=UPI001268D69E|nr:hypothetical protein [Microbulbifer sp. THAF38]QFT55199.1 hypothetical protein FIU95_11585 [Microbulbifer sp. THAF38]